MSVFLLFIFSIGGQMAQDGVSFTVVYDNDAVVEGVKPDWGFSCFIKGKEKTILFDTGTDGDILLSNMEKCEIAPKDVEILFISHDHLDHTGGLLDFLEVNPSVTLYVPASFSQETEITIKEKGTEFIRVKEGCEICPGVYSTGEMGTSIKEQSLIVMTEKALAVVTGCAHPGIENIVTRVGDLYEKDITLVFGGFHLLKHTSAEILKIIQKFREIGIKKVGSGHCSGDEAQKLFAKEYGENYVTIGVGKVITIE